MLTAMSAMLVLIHLMRGPPSPAILFSSEIFHPKRLQNVLFSMDPLGLFLSRPLFCVSFVSLA